MGFWLQFSIQEALAVAGAFIGSTSNLTPAQKAAGQNFIIAGEAFVASFAAPVSSGSSTLPAS